MSDLQHIQGIEEVHGVDIQLSAPLEGKGGQLGLSGMLNAISGQGSMDGYKVATDQHVYHVLIDNAQSCCESWGYLASADDLKPFIGAQLLDVRLTDTALNTESVEASDYYSGDEGGIQFVDFVTDRGVFQLAVYNGHNGYYGHGVIVAKDQDVLLSDTL